MAPDFDNEVEGALDVRSAEDEALVEVGPPFSHKI